MNQALLLDCTTNIATTIYSFICHSNSYIIRTYSTKQLVFFCIVKRRFVYRLQIVTRDLLH